MSAVIEASVAFICFEHTSGIVNGCRECGTNHNHGYFAIEVKIVGDDTKYYLGFDKPYPRCCGKEKPHFIQTFQTAAFGLKAAREAQSIADTEGVEALNLVSHYDYMQNAIYD